MSNGLIENTSMAGNTFVHGNTVCNNPFTSTLSTEHQAHPSLVRNRGDLSYNVTTNEQKYSV